MPLKYGVFLPQGHLGELASIKDSVNAYETLTRVAQTAEKLFFREMSSHMVSLAVPRRFVSVWLPTKQLASRNW